MSDKKQAKYGEIWMCNLCSKDESVQHGYRPVFVLSNDMNNTFSPTINVIPITSKTSKKSLPIHVYLMNYEKYGLKKPSMMLVEQITTISSTNLDMKIGSIDDEFTLSRIYNAIGIQFPIVSMFAI